MTWNGKQPFAKLPPWLPRGDPFGRFPSSMFHTVPWRPKNRLDEGFDQVGPEQDPKLTAMPLCLFVHILWAFS